MGSGQGRVECLSSTTGWPYQSPYGKPVVGGEAHEKWTCDLVAVSDRHGVAVPVLVFALGLGSASVLELVLSNGLPLVGDEGDTQVVLVDGVDHPGGSDGAVHLAAWCPAACGRMLLHCYQQ